VGVTNNIRALTATDRATDFEIAEAVRASLLFCALAPNTRIRSTVSDGVVTLQGPVSTFRERDDAAQSVRALRGVRAVNNWLEVAAPDVSEDTLREAIEAAVRRRAHRFTARIRIAIRGGEVFLRGDAGSLAERDAIVGAVRGTRGVRAIEDRIRVVHTPSP
jgi:osmotically-inducible protein OsmY